MKFLEFLEFNSIPLQGRFLKSFLKASVFCFVYRFQGRKHDAILKFIIVVNHETMSSENMRRNCQPNDSLTMLEPSKFQNLSEIVENAPQNPISRNGLWFRFPTQFPIQPQMWSPRITKRPSAREKQANEDRCPLANAIWSEQIARSLSWSCQPY
jgi:hypothetical protein